MKIQIAVEKNNRRVYGLYNVDAMNLPDGEECTPQSNPAFFDHINLTCNKSGVYDAIKKNVGTRNAPLLVLGTSDPNKSQTFQNVYEENGALKLA